MSVLIAGINLCTWKRVCGRAVSTAAGNLNKKQPAAVRMVNMRVNVGNTNTERTPAAVFGCRADKILI